MFSNNLFSAPTLVLLGILGVNAMNAQTPTCYSLASLPGQYAIVGIYGANQAVALGMRYYDGKGNLTGTFVVNEPTAGSTTGARTIVTGTQAGTYTVNCDGTGVVTRTVTASNGVTAIQIDDLIITSAFAKYDASGNPLLLATSISDAPRVPSAIVPGGVLLIRSFTRLPDRPAQ